MFLLQTKTLFVEATQEVFDRSYPSKQMRGIGVSMEFPDEATFYPGIWVTFTPTSQLQVAGLGHNEFIANPDGTFRKGGRWRFGGNVQFTCVAMSSVERDTIIDEVIKVMAFGGEHPALSRFRRKIEVNDLIQISAQWDTIGISGVTETQGTPWGTGETVYEGTVSVDMQGSFVSDTATDESLVPLSAIVIREQAPDEPAPVFPTSPGDPNTGWM